MKNGLVKTILSSICIATVLSGFFSCEGKKKTMYKIGFSQCVANDAWRRAMHEEMFRELSFYPDLDLEIKNAQGNSQTQISQIREFLQEGIDLLIVSPNESEPITPIVEEAFQNGIPVIIIDRKINSNLYSAYIGGDNYEIGYTAGQYIRNILNGKGRLLEIWGLRGSSPAKDRHNGLLDALKGSDIQIVFEIEGKWEKDTARTQLRNNLLQEDYPEFDLVFGHNDVMAIGAFEVCQSFQRMGKKFVGVDALPGPYGGIQAVADGILNATFFYPTGGDKAIEVASKVLSGELYDKENILQTTAVDSSNIRIMKQQTDRIINQEKRIVRQKNMIDTQLEIYQSQRGLLMGFGVTLFVSIISLAYIFKSLKEKQEINKELQKKNNEVLKQQKNALAYAKKAEEATQHKLEFFTNISHEFRTPLTLIQAPIEEMIQNKDAAAFRSDLLLIRKNTFRLLSLVNQLMDFRKIDSGKMQVRASEQALVPFMEEIMSVFAKSAKDNQIAFRMICENPNIQLCFDPTLMDKVFFNLLSNAFKFTPKKGFIHIRMEEDPLNHEVLIQIEDSGTGMGRDEIAHVFDRFYQGNPGMRKIGSGLGLALSKELVELQRGSIDVASVPGEKTVFEIRLKMGKTHFEPQELSSETISYQILDHENIFPEEEEHLSKDKFDSSGKQCILVIEDDSDIRDYLQKKLKANYNILEAEDAEAGLSIAMDEIPDLITCDIMLKKGNGLDLIKVLKSTPATAQIPILVISAKTTQQDLLKGMEIGIDDYITKPFSISIVLQRIKNILANRSLIKEHYLHQLPAGTKSSRSPNSDKKFEHEFTLLIEDNISNPSFGVNEICEKMGLSRGKLYRKAKSVLGYSVNDYIIKVRLKKAKHLLIHDSDSISGIAFKSGFSTSAYFSTVFNNAFGVTPSKFRESHSNYKN